MINKIKERKAVVGVIGLGYVGLPLCIEFARAGFNVKGIDIDKRKINCINNGESYIFDISPEEVKSYVQKGLFTATSDFSILKEIDCVSICVPTPLRKTKDPDISFIVAATDQIKKYLHKEQLIVLESTTYPGTTDEIILPELEKNGFRVGKDFYLAFSPERVDPGNKDYNTRNTPKIIGGVTDNCRNMAKELYGRVIDSVITVSSTKSAEMVKLLENTFRAVNIALVNEITLMCDKLEIDAWEIIDAAGTKPFGFMKFYPGPGLGGHCIPIDPHYLAWKLKTLDYKARFIELAGEVNTSMPFYVLEKVTNVLNDFKKSVNGANILILGVAYKKDINDVRESPALDIIRLLKNKHAKVCFNDPYISSIEGYTDVEHVELTKGILHRCDCIVLTTNHSSYDYPCIIENSKIIVDTRNATEGIERKNSKCTIVKL